MSIVAINNKIKELELINNKLNKEELLIKKDRLIRIINDLNNILNDNNLKNNGYKYNEIMKKYDRMIEKYSLGMFLNVPTILLLVPFVSTLIRNILFIYITIYIISFALLFRFKRKAEIKNKDLELYYRYYSNNDNVDDSIIIKDIKINEKELEEIKSKLEIIFNNEKQIIRLKELITDNNLNEIKEKINILKK